MLNQPFFQVALPLIITIAIAVWVNNKAIDGIHKRLDDIVTRLTRIENLLADHDKRLTTLETSKWK